MKILPITFILLFSLIFSSNSFAEWTKIGKNTNGDTFYVDFDRIRKVDGYVYYWELTDFAKPIQKYLSGKIYKQVDCRLFRFKWLSLSYHKLSMGKGFGDEDKPVKKHQSWKYPQPNSIGETVTQSVCDQ